MKTKIILIIGMVLAMLVINNVSAMVPSCAWKAWFACVTPCEERRMSCEMDCEMTWGSGNSGYQSCMNGCHSRSNQCEAGCNYFMAGLGEVPIWDRFGQD